MAARQIYNPDGFKNVSTEAGVVGFQFQFKSQYYRGVTLSIVRGIEVNIDGEDIDKKDIRFTVNGETFTLDEMRTVVDSDYRWEFGEYATVTVLKEGGLSQGKHHLKVLQTIVPSYMPFPWSTNCETDFVI